MFKIYYFVFVCVCVWCESYLMFILWVLNPSNGSSTRLVAKSSVSHSSLTLILYDPSMFAHHPHAERRRTGRRRREKKSGKVRHYKRSGRGQIYVSRVVYIRYAITVMKKYRKSALAVIHRFSFFKLIYLIIR